MNETKKCPCCATEFVFGICSLHETAPACLKALEITLASLEGHHEALGHDWEGVGDRRNRCDTCKEIKEARTAIAQAKGESVTSS